MNPTVLVGKSRIRKADVCVCETCDKTFLRANSEVKRGGGRFCCLACIRVSKPTYITKTCQQCPNQWTVKKSHADRKKRFCSDSCRTIYRHLNKQKDTKGTRHYGARVIYRKFKGIPKCRVFWCKRTKIHIHHLNHKNWDNRPRNLIALCNHHHGLYHSFVRRFR